ncbi:MAG: exo-alpha-sialidase [Clostridia bacterium]|nr:exo-alpha-sialidase [Clostridia bacterium]
MMKRIVALLLLTVTLASCTSQIPKDIPEAKETDATMETKDTIEPEVTAPTEEKTEPTLTVEENGVLKLGSERQLFLDTFLIDAEKSDAYINPETPVKQEAVFRFDKSFERGDCVYQNIVRMPDGSYRMYYKAYAGLRRICYIESKDGLTWTRPELTTNRFGGQNTNIVTTDDASPDNLFVFYDTNPDCSDGRRLKGVYGQWGEFLAIQYSYNGKGEHFPFSGTFGERVMGKAPTTEGCYYDTLNTMYWDEYREQYVAFVRGFHNEKGNYALSATFVTNYPTKVLRDIRVSFSDDAKSWSIPEPLKYNVNEDHQMYANAITPYYRSPGLYVGMPTRYFEESGDKRTQVFFMSSRDLINWNRTETPYLKPEEGESFSYSQGNGYPCVGFIETGEGEMSFYMKEKSHGGGVPTLYRYTLRADGFTSAMGSTLTTKPFTYKGDSLELNFTGEVRVTMTGKDGVSVVSQWLTGDEIARTVEFDGELPEGECVLSFEMKEGTKLYSFKFN